MNNCPNCTYYKHLDKWDTECTWFRFNPYPKTIRTGNVGNSASVVTTSWAKEDESFCATFKERNSHGDPSEQ